MQAGIYSAHSPSHLWGFTCRMGFSCAFRLETSKTVRSSFKIVLCYLNIYLAKTRLGVLEKVN